MLHSKPLVLKLALFLTFSGSAFAAPQPNVSDRWVKNLLSDKSEEADQAVLKVFQEGRHVFPDLLELTGSQKLFSGQFPFNDYESQARSERPTVGVVCLYLLQAVCEKDLFFARPWIVPRDSSIKVHGSTPLTTPGAQELAARAFHLTFGYPSDFNLFGHLNPSPTVTPCNPLDGTKFKWLNGQE